MNDDNWQHKYPTYNDVTDPDTVFQCRLCGALVINQTLHNVWHQQIGIDLLARFSKELVDTLQMIDEES